MLNGFCALCTPFVRDGVLFNHLIKLLKFFIDQKSQSVKVRLVLAAKLVRTDGVFHRSMRCPGGEIGRHKGFKIPRLSSRAGSSPARGTIILKTHHLGALAEWPCSGLQIREPRFDSGTRLHYFLSY